MFKRSDAGYSQLSFPFARSVEDVASPTALWVRAADDYAKLLSGRNGPQRRSAFDAERKRLLAIPNDEEAQLIATDIERYLNATSDK
jgi:hypothetical protein